MDLVSQNLLMTSGGKKDPTYVDDVFSTYLYKGNGVGKNISNGIKLGNSNAGNSVDFANNGTLVVPTSADFKFGTGAFTIEFFIYYVLATDYVSIFDGRPVNTNGNQTTMGLFTNGQLNWWSLGANAAVIANSSSTQLTGNAWTHVAYVREGTGANEAKMYFNGSLVGTGTDNQDYAINQLCRIGGHPWSPGTSNISISNYRVIKGTALYTSNFTPPTQALTDISGTVLLCCQSSSDPFAATVTPGAITIGSQGQAANPSAQSFGPFTATDGEGGLVWIKSRTNTYNHILQDTVNGTGKFLKSNGNDAATNTNQYITSFDNSGYTLGFDNDINNGSQNFSSWSFRKAKGFFDIVTWTQSGSDGAARTISHSLGSIPGFIMLKQTTGTENWICYHRDFTTNQFIKLNSNHTVGTDANASVNSVSSTQFVVGADNNKVGSYVAYVFAGGASTAATARSVHLDGNDYLSLADTTDLEPGSGDFTIEAWVKPDSDATSYDYVFSNGWGQQISWYHSGSGETKFRAWFNDAEDSNYNVSLNSNWACAPRGAWSHVAVVRNGNVFTLYVNGKAETSVTASFTVSANTDLPLIGEFGGSGGSSYAMKGKISNFRYTKGQALYTTSFTPSTEPLTTTSQGATASNVKLLCCNNSSTTGSTVTPGTITANGDPTASTESPFDDSEGFKFGEEGDQNLVKCGSYVGTAQDNEGPMIDMGFEPQWILIKNINTTNDWRMFDCMRGIATARDSTNGQDARFNANDASAETDSNDKLDLTSRGYVCMEQSPDLNGNGNTMIYIAIRRPDPLVGKPPEAGTDVFAMDTGSNSGTIPCFDSGFAADYALQKLYTGTQYWQSISRLTGYGNLETNQARKEEDYTGYIWDSNSGININFDSTNQAWMWKRHAGMDVVCYKGSSSTPVKTVMHSLGRVPEMIWIKARDDVQNWFAYHKGLNGGTTPWNYHIVLNSSDAEGAYSFINQPTTVDFTVKSAWQANDETYISMLFASVEGISKVGYYTGTGSNLTITTGFQPRFVLVKNTTDAGMNWFILDTRRGWGAGNDPFLVLNNTAAQNSGDNFGAPTATGFTWTISGGMNNASGKNYIYYAHA